MNLPLDGRVPIIAGVDGSAEAIDAVRWAARAALRHHLPLELVHATAFTDLLVASVVPPTDETKDLIRRHGRHLLRAAHEVACGAGASDVRERLDPDRPAQALLDLAGEATAVVVGHGRGRFGALLAGSVATALAAHAPRPVVVARGDLWDAPTVSGPVVAGIDGGPDTAAVVAAAFAEAASLGATLLVLHAKSDPDVGETATALDEVLEEPGRRHPDVHVEHTVVAGRPRHELLERSAHAQLVVLGRRGRGGFPGLLLGSTAQALVHHASCPVLITHAGEQTSSQP
ncbi:MULTISPECIES: universal stress protein [unclassified Amycolatopsis]|uniref:universal stress protein n=1 Tax=unclassified Amycolatopsis TaxID=2618356 RepID=UPI001C6A7949|nr:universal stress protein [Amycolatopsis sp. DSM 110486]QYN20308.1 universal stress protein [Amycolatopsis sp. DSM 110486]